MAIRDNTAAAATAVDCAPITALVRLTGTVLCPLYDGGAAGSEGDVPPDGDGAGDGANESNGDPVIDVDNGDAPTIDDAGGNALLLSEGVDGGVATGVGDVDNGI